MEGEQAASQRLMQKKNPEPWYLEINISSVLHYKYDHEAKANGQCNAHIKHNLKQKSRQKQKTSKDRVQRMQPQSRCLCKEQLVNKN